MAMRQISPQPRLKYSQWPSAVTHGSGRQHPGDVQPPGAPQSASVLHVPKRFDGEFVTQRFSPVVPCSKYVLAIG